MPKTKVTENDDLAKGILEAVDLDSYRLTRITEDDIKLSGGGELAPTPSIMKGSKEKANLKNWKLSSMSLMQDLALIHGLMMIKLKNSYLNNYLLPSQKTRQQ